MDSGGSPGHKENHQGSIENFSLAAKEFRVIYFGNVYENCKDLKEV